MSGIRIMVHRWITVDTVQKRYVSSAILLYDVDYVEVKGLELTNESDDAQYIQNGLANTSARMDRTGVAGIAKDGGTMDHVYLEAPFISTILTEIFKINIWTMEESSSTYQNRQMNLKQGLQDIMM
ncbi:MAG: hypothetical protein ACLTKE_09730 [Coprococcus sp.]